MVWLVSNHQRLFPKLGLLHMTTREKWIVGGWDKNNWTLFSFSFNSFACHFSRAGIQNWDAGGHKCWIYLTFLQFYPCLLSSNLENPRPRPRTFGDGFNRTQMAMGLESHMILTILRRWQRRPEARELRLWGLEVAKRPSEAFLGMKNRSFPSCFDL